MTDETSAVSMAAISKRFGSIVANDAVHFDLQVGEVHALLGENGAGKSTLMNILFGLVEPDAGSIEVFGRSVNIGSPRQAASMGIGMVHQHFKLVPTLTVSENIMLSEHRRFRLTRRDRTRVDQELAELADRHGLHVDPTRPVWQLSVGERQRVEILKALRQAARVLILDEPTATLAPAEIDALLPELKALAATGMSLILITHHLDEVLEVADRITVLRGGRHVGTVPAGSADTRSLAAMMIGTGDTVTDDVLAELSIDAAAHRPVPGAVRPSSTARSDAPVFEIRGLTAWSDQGHEAIRDLSFAVRSGEILAIGGVEGNGQTELEEVLMGVRQPASGSILLDGVDMTKVAPSDRLDGGLAIVPSDRQRHGLAGSLSVAANLIADRVDRPPIGSRFRMDAGRAASEATSMIERFRIKVGSPSTTANMLSGGNAQRVVLARALHHRPRVLVAAQPTRGLDVHAVEYVHEQLLSLARSGSAVLLISTDLAELFSAADRFLVMYRGQLFGPWIHGELDREQVGLAMGGHDPFGREEARS